MIQKSYDNSPTLYIVPTPIGNLEDMTFRAIKILKEVDTIFCEDTRDTKQLLSYFNINNKLFSNHKFNEVSTKNKILQYLDNGKNVAVVSDRGTPGISDPGYEAIKHIINSEYNVVCLPGANAIIPAIIMSGMTPQPFVFYGFLNSKSSKQIEELKHLEEIEYNIVFYEAPHRLKNTLGNISQVFGNRNISLVREISKLHEEVIRDSIDNVIKICDFLKGEFVIIVEGKKKEDVDYSGISILEHINKYINLGFSEKDAIKKVAKDRKTNKNEIYQEFHRR